MTGRRAGSIRRRQGDLRREPGYAVPVALLVAAVGSGCASESGDRAEHRGARPPAGQPGAPAGQASPPRDLSASAEKLDLEWRERDRDLRPGDIILTHFRGATDWDGSLAAMIRAVMKTITDKGYAVARLEACV